MEKEPHTSPIAVNLSLLILCAIAIILIGFIFTWGKGMLELIYALVHYLEAATRALEDGKAAGIRGPVRQLLTILLCGC